MSGTHDPERRISAKQANRVICLDFEGRIEEPPALIGFSCEGEFVQRVLSEAAKAKRLDVSPFYADVRTIARRWMSLMREILGWGHTEMVDSVALHDSESPLVEAVQHQRVLADGLPSEEGVK
jgi:hypothetical protein